MNQSGDEWEVHYLPDVDCVVRCNLKEAVVDFEAFESGGWSPDQSQPEADSYGVVRTIFERKGWKQKGDVDLNDLDNAQTVIRGRIGWDGCSHFYFGYGDNEGYVHICGTAEGRRISKLIDHLFHLCWEMYLGCKETSSPRDYWDSLDQYEA